MNHPSPKARYQRLILQQLGHPVKLRLALCLAVPAERDPFLQGQQGRLDGADQRPRRQEFHFLRCNDIAGDPAAANHGISVHIALDDRRLSDNDRALRMYFAFKPPVDPDGPFKT